MLYRQVEEKEKDGYGVGIVIREGTCRFCGQMAVNKALKEWSDDEIDELATETCECDEARSYSQKKEQKEETCERIDLLFGDLEESGKVSVAAVELFHKAAETVCEGFARSVTVDIGNGVKGKISDTSKGTIKVERKKTDIRKSEI